MVRDLRALCNAIVQSSEAAALGISGEIGKKQEQNSLRTWYFAAAPPISPGVRTRTQTFSAVENNKVFFL